MVDTEPPRKSRLSHLQGASQREPEGWGPTRLQPSQAWAPHSAAVHGQWPRRFLKRNQTLHQGVDEHRLLAAVKLT